MHNSAQHLLKRKNCGLTLIELLIALTLSSLVLLMAYSLLAYRQRYLQIHQQQIHQQQNKQFTQFILRQAIWQAGFFGCRSLANSSLHNQL